MSTKPASEQPAAASPHQTVSPRYANYVLGLLFVLYIFNFIDRQILAILQDAIKAELQLHDWQLGLLTGFAFALFYTFAGLPIARLADRSSRVNIITVALLVWSAMTAGSGVVRSYVQLVAARVGVGVGEAGFVPPAHSLISDYFPPQRRATAMAVFSMGIYIGVAFGFSIGGAIAARYGWRSAFFAVGVPGLLLALLLRATVREPVRGHSEGGLGDDRAESVGDVVRFMRGLRAFRHVALGAAIHSFGGYAFANWGPPLYLRVYEMDIAVLGRWLGIILGLGGALGSILGGVLADRLGARDLRWVCYVPGLATLGAIPFLVLILFAPTWNWSLLFLVPNSILGAMWFGPVFATVQGLVKLRMRAIASAVLVFIINIIGLGLGPLAVGILNDALAPRFGAEAIRYSLLIIVAANVWAGVHFFLGARTLREDMRAKDAVQPRAL